MTDVPKETLSAAGRSLAVGTAEEVIKSLQVPYNSIDLHVIAECKNPQSSAGGWTFDLATLSRGRIYVLSARIWQEDVTAIQSRLHQSGTTLEEALVDGMLLGVEGKPRRWAETGDLYMKVTSIRSDFRMADTLHLKDDRTLQALMKAFPGHHRLVVSEEEIHSQAKEPLRIGQLKKIMVIGPQRSQGVDDFQYYLNTSRRQDRPHIEYRKMTWTGGAAAATFRRFSAEAHTERYDLIVIARGGGHWRSLSGFQDEDLAREILTSAVPVVTAIGHRENVSIADRAAHASFITPTAAAAAITAEKRNQAAASRRSEHALRADVGTVSVLKREAEEARLALVDVRQRLATALQTLNTANEALANSSRVLYETNRQTFLSTKKHTDDLLELATRRVRGFSWVLTCATLLCVAVLLTNTEQLLALFTVDHNPMSALALIGGCTLGGLLAMKSQLSARKNADKAYTRPMKRPPETPDEWAEKIKNVRSARALRKLRCHRPTQ